jgi:Ca2+-binding RTX toxin-like protein
MVPITILTQNSNLSLQLSGLSDYAYVRLVADKNANGIYDSGEILYDDYGSSSSTAEVNSALGAGAYFAWVDQYGANYNTNYTLSLSATASPVTTPSDPGSNFNTALNLGNLSAPRTYQDFVGTVDGDDFYRFNLTQNSNLSLQLSGLSDYAYVRLVADKNGNGLYDSGEILYDDYGSSGSTAEVNSALGAGAYFAWVDQYGANYNTNYTLSLSATASPVTTPSDPGSNFNTALNLGNLSSPRTYQDFVGTVDGDDFYRFNLTQNSNLSLQLSGLSDYAYVRLVADKNGNGLYDSGEILYDDYGYSSSTAEVNSALGAGAYFAWVDQYGANYNTNYTLSLFATVNTPSNDDDYIIGDYNDNTINGLNGNDYIQGNSGNDALSGGSGNDNLWGGSGNDTMIGGTGNDIYDVDSSGDVVSETAVTATEIDLVQASITYTLGANLENLTLTGVSAINGTGNSLNNTITGNSATNLIAGGAGNDTMTGDAGNDIYVVGSSGDVVNETSVLTTEIDTVQSGITYSLGANVERLTLTGTSAINGTGNSLNNTITGNSAANLISGGVGNDTMIGGAGNDIYVVGSSGDVVNETSVLTTEIDTVQSGVSHTLGANVERLTLLGNSAINGTGNNLKNTITGNSADNTLFGGIGSDTISGGLGSDRLIGASGNDSLTGGDGSDRFIYDSNAAFVTSAVGTDQITDFVSGTDKIVLDKTTFTALTSIAGNGFNLASEFAVVGSDAAASTSSALIVYSSESDNLFYNQNGVTSGLGSGAQLATLSGITTLSANDFELQA